MITDYKITVQQEQDGIFYQKVRFYEGDITTEDEYDPLLGSMKPVKRYRRTAMYDEVEYWYEVS